jgi:flagellar L-ring protein precursor FlgH
MKSLTFPSAIRLAIATLTAALAACTTPLPPPKVDVQGPVHAMPDATPLPVARNGAIYQQATFRPIFEDHRARIVGDTLTVQIIEKVSASQKSNSTVNKTGGINAGITALPGINPKALARASATGSTANTFAGKGETESTNDFSGTITAIVTGVLPNGHLMIAGEKQIGVNHNVDVLRFSGQVDPRAIQTGNSVPSANIANVRIEHRGRGQQAEAQGIGWLSRFFLNVLPI